MFHRDAMWIEVRGESAVSMVFNCQCRFLQSHAVIAVTQFIEWPRRVGRAGTRDRNQKQTRKPLWFAVIKYSQSSFPYYSNCVPFIRRIHSRMSFDASLCEQCVFENEHQRNLEASQSFFFLVSLMKTKHHHGMFLSSCLSTIQRQGSLILLNVAFTIARLQAVW